MKEGRKCMKEERMKGRIWKMERRKEGNVWRDEGRKKEERKEGRKEPKRYVFFQRHRRKANELFLNSYNSFIKIIYIILNNVIRLINKNVEIFKYWTRLETAIILFINYWIFYLKIRIQVQISTNAKCC